MKILIYGGEACGKSAEAERIAVELAKKDDLPLYYIATMDKNAGGDTLERIQKHRKMREGKGFVTLERTKDLKKLRLPEKKGVVLLEDLGNLVANELFTGLTAPASIDRHDVNSNYAMTTKIRSEAKSSAALSASVSVYADSVARKIADGLEAIGEQAEHFVIVSNNVLDDSSENLDTDCYIYLQTLASVSNIFAESCDEVKEIVAGIAISVK